MEEVGASVGSGWIGTGPRVARLEEDFRHYKQASHAVAVNSCTAALHLSMLAADLQPGDEVITTPLTFCSTVNAIIHAKLTPVLADVNPITMNIDPAQIESRITEKTRAALVVHYAGRSCDMDTITTLTTSHNLKLLEDCAHAIETRYHDQPAGTLGHFGCFSFYVTKNMITGEGGMVITGDEAAAARIKVLALHGMSKDAWKRFSDEGYRHYYVTEAGFKYNMMDLQAAIGLHQLARIESAWLRRAEIWKRYQQAFAELPVTCPADSEPDTRHAYHLYTILIDETKTGISRDRFLDAMTYHHIGVGVHYLSVPEHPFYQESYGWKPEDYPNAMKIGRETVSLPLSPALTDEDVEDVINAVRIILENAPYYQSRRYRD